MLCRRHNGLMESTFDLIWLSTREHLEHFQEIREATPWYRVFLGGGYDVPQDFPFIEIGRQRFPLVYSSSGALTIAEQLITYSARNPSNTGLGRRRHTIDASLAFSVDIAQHPTLGRFRARGSPSYFSINWIELFLPERSLLLCAGARGPGMSRVNRRTDSLFGTIST
jgi:hypothetical protein